MPNPQRPDPGAAGLGDRLGYFMVRIRHSAADPPGEFAGVVERLGTGEKRAIRNIDELARVIDEWSQRPSAL